MRTVAAGHQLLPKGLEPRMLERGNRTRKHLGGIRREEVHLPALRAWFLPGA